MKIRTKLRLNALAALVLAVFVLAAVLLTQAKVNRLVYENRDYHTLVQKVFGLDKVLDDYLTYPDSPRVRRQWGMVHGSLGDILKKIETRHGNNSGAVNSLLENYARLEPLINQLAAAQGSGEGSLQFTEQREILSDQLSINLASMITLSSNAFISNQEIIVAAQQRAANITGLLLITWILVSGATFLLLARRLNKSLMELNKGAAVIGAGNLAHRIVAATRDELGELGQAFNEMAGKLSGTYAAFEAEVAERKRAEQGLRKTTQILNAVSRNVPDLLFAKDCQCRLVYASDSTLRLLGKTADEALGKTDAEFHPDPRIGEAVMENDRIVRETRRPLTVEEPTRLPDGSVRVFLSTKVPWIEEDGTLLGTLGIAVDITARKQAEEALRELNETLEQRVAERTARLEEANAQLQAEIVERRRAEGALRESEERFRSIADNQSEGLMLFDPQGSVIYQNPASLRLHGYSVPADGRIALEKLPATWQGWDDQGRPLPLDQWPISRVVHGERFQNQVLHARRQDTGLEFDASYNGCPICDAAGNVVLGFITIRELTEQRKAEAALRESEAKYRTLFENMTEEVHFWQIVRDDDGQIITWRLVDANPPTIKSWGRNSFDEIKGKTTDEIFGSGASDHYMPVVQKIVTEGVPYSFTDYFPNLDKYFRFTSVPLGDYFITTGADITDIKKAELALRESEERFRVAQELSPDGFSILRPVRDPEGRVVDFTWIFVNATTERILDMKLPALAGRSLLELFPGHRGSPFLEIYRQAAETGQTLVQEALYQGNGVLTQRWFRVAVVSMGQDIAVLSQDITERKRMEEELRKSRDELELRVQERTTELEKANQELFTEIEARKRVEVVVRAERKRFFDVLETLPVYICLLTPDYHVPFVNRVFRERFGVSEGLRCFEHLFGRSEPCEVCETYKVLETMAPQEWEWTGPDGRNYSVFDFPFSDTDGSSLILEMGIDITERKQAEAELSATVARLEQSNQSLQDFASIASHDMREPLRKVISFGNMLRQKYADSLGQTGNDYLSRMIEASQRMQTLLTSLLDYSKVTITQEPFEEVDLYDVVHDVLSDLEVRIAKTGGEVQVGELPVLAADHTQMRQLFQNLIGNALKFHKEGEKPVVKVLCDASDDANCLIVVEDNGIGFDEQHLDRIFAPFQRLHGRSSPFEGTGMGLAICKKIVERHGGSITARSEPGRGSAFVVTLPIKQDAGRLRPDCAG
jgi:PAS domain S-box-containing protein